MELYVIFVVSAVLIVNWCSRPPKAWREVEGYDEFRAWVRRNQ